jgi:transcriptional regulator with XRE-family HTH domain
MGNKVDVHVGGRVRRTRQFRGMELIELADRIGVSTSQLYRYEQGMERFAPEHLLKVARVLGISPSFFFNGLKGEEIPEVEPFRAIAAPANDNAVDVSGRQVH